MKIRVLSMILLIFTVSLSSIASWDPFGPDSLVANRICFNLDNFNHWGVCHDGGLCLYDLVSQTWTDHPTDMPVWDAHYLDGENILVIMGCGTDSDGIYSYNTDGDLFELKAYVECPNFIAYDEIIQKYYVGHHLGLVSSFDGTFWSPESTFENMSIVDMEIYQNHIVLSQLDNIFSVWHSSDHGNSWTQSPAGSPMISDLQFDHNQQLYGIFPDNSYSSGLWSSTDYGYTWDVEFWSVYMNCVGIDVFGDVYVGWGENFPGGEEGIARWDPDRDTLIFINEGLSSLVINEIRTNPAMSAIALFCCTDSGAYVSYDYFVGMEEMPERDDQLVLDIFPNPVMNEINLTYQLPVKNSKPAICVFTSNGKKIIESGLSEKEGRIILNVSRLPAGIYYVIIDEGEEPYCRRFLKL
jgi:hypothetical protein